MRDPRGSKAKEERESAAWLAAIQTNDVGAVESMIKAGRDAGWRDGDGYTSLCLAALVKAVGVGRALIEAGCDVDARIGRGMTAAHHAAWLGGDLGRGALGMLIESGCDIEAQDDDGWTVLHFAAHADNMAGEELILDAGCDLEARSGQGRTPAFLAADAGHAGCLARLIRAGADEWAVDSQGLSVMDVARAKLLAESLALVQAAIDAREMGKVVPSGASSIRTSRL